MDCHFAPGMFKIQDNGAHARLRPDGRTRIFTLTLSAAIARQIERILPCRFLSQYRPEERKYETDVETESTRKLLPDTQQ
jgi:hypothetical protein